MRDYKSSDSYLRSQKVGPQNGKPVYPLKFDLTAPAKPFRAGARA